MNLLSKNTEFENLKKNPPKPYVWTLKADLKISIADYKSYINGGISDEVFTKKLKALLYTHFKKNHEEDSTESVEFTEEELMHLSMTPQEFKICLKDIEGILMGLVKIRVENPIESSSAYTVVITLVK